MDWHRRQRYRIYRGGAQSIHSWYRPLVRLDPKATRCTFLVPTFGLRNVYIVLLDPLSES
jgi:hypothetical protein